MEKFDFIEFPPKDDLKIGGRLYDSINHISGETGFLQGHGPGWYVIKNFIWDPDKNTLDIVCENEVNGNTKTWTWHNASFMTS